MKPILAATLAALFVSGAAMAQTDTTPSGGMQSSPPPASTANPGYQGQGGSSGSTSGTHRHSRHQSSKHSTHAKTQGTHPPSTAGTLPGTAVGTDATQSGTATAPTN